MNKISNNDLNANLELIEPYALIRVVYTSSPTLISHLNSKVFESIEDDSCHFNKVNHITGVLCYGNGHFLQCIEGKKQDVVSLLDKITKDKRHKGYKLLLAKPIEERIFKNWHMKMLFLERWIWSPETKSQADSVSKFLPFKPDKWTEETTDDFVRVISKLDTPPDVKHKKITFNTLGKMIQTFVGPHQAFLFVQLILLFLAIIIITVLFRTSHM